MIRAPVVIDARVVSGVGGGPDKTLLNSPRFFKPLGYRMLCAYMHAPDDPGWTTLKRRAVELDAPLLSIPDRGPLDPRVVTAALRLCQEHNAAIWHGHDYKSNVLGLVLQPLWPMRLVTTVHGWGVQAARTAVYYCIDRWSLRYYEKVLCVSEDLKQECLSAGVAEENCLLLENGVDTEQFRRTQSPAEAKARLGIPADRLVIGGVARLSAEKGFDILLRAAIELRQRGINVHVVLVGDGPERSRLEKLAAEPELRDRVHFLGHMPDPRPAFEAFDVYALSSHREGLPNVLLEAMAMETPVVATRIAGVPRLIEHESNGLLVEPGNRDALTAALFRVLQDSDLRGRLASEGRATIEGRYCFRRRIERLAALYDEMLGMSARSPGQERVARPESSKGVGTSSRS